MRKRFALSIAVLLLAGCAGPQVPTTRFKLPGGLSLECPKQVEVTNLIFKYDTNGHLNVSVGYLRSMNDADVIAQTSLMQIEQMKQANQMGANAIEMMKQAAAIYGKIQSGGLAPTQ